VAELQEILVMGQRTISTHLSIEAGRLVGRPSHRQEQSLPLDIADVTLGRPAHPGARRDPRSRLRSAALRRVLKKRKIRCAAFFDSVAAASEKTSAGKSLESLAEALLRLLPPCDCRSGRR